MKIRDIKSLCYLLQKLKRIEISPECARVDSGIQQLNNNNNTQKKLFEKCFCHKVSYKAYHCAESDYYQNMSKR